MALSSALPLAGTVGLSVRLHTERIERVPARALCHARVDLHERQGRHHQRGGRCRLQRGGP